MGNSRIVWHDDYTNPGVEPYWKICTYTGLDLSECICLVHDPKGDNFRKSRGMEKQPKE